MEVEFHAEGNRVHKSPAGGEERPFEELKEAQPGQSVGRMLEAGLARVQ